MSKLQVTVLAVIVLLFALFLLVRFTHQPVAVVCDRGKPNVKLISTNKHGYFVEHHIGPCVTYTHKVRHPTGIGDNARHAGVIPGQRGATKGDNLEKALEDLSKSTTGEALESYTEHAQKRAAYEKVVKALREARETESANCVEKEFSEVELRIDGVLGSSL